jgi:solute carrier family 44 protein 1 (choline transporter-like protein)
MGQQHLHQRAKWKFEAANEYNESTESGKRRIMSYLIFAIVATIITIVVCLVILVMRKRIKLVIQLFKEAGKAISSMPLLLLEPILVSIGGNYRNYLVPS